jgi:hypothetical protein
VQSQEESSGFFLECDGILQRKDIFRVLPQENCSDAWPLFSSRGASAGFHPKFENTFVQSNALNSVRSNSERPDHLLNAILQCLRVYNLSSDQIPFAFALLTTLRGANDGHSAIMKSIPFNCIEFSDIVHSMNSFLELESAMRSASLPESLSGSRSAVEVSNLIASRMQNIDYSMTYPPCTSFRNDGVLLCSPLYSMKKASRRSQSDDRLLIRRGDAIWLYKRLIDAYISGRYRKPITFEMQSKLANFAHGRVNCVLKESDGSIMSNMKSGSLSVSKAANKYSIPLTPLIIGGASKNEINRSSKDANTTVSSVALTFASLNYITDNLNDEVSMNPIDNSVDVEQLSVITFAWPNQSEFIKFLSALADVRSIFKTAIRLDSDSSNHLCKNNLEHSEDIREPLRIMQQVYLFCHSRNLLLPTNIELIFEPGSIDINDLNMSSRPKAIFRWDPNDALWTSKNYIPSLNQTFNTASPRKPKHIEEVAPQRGQISLPLLLFIEQHACSQPQVN